LLPTDEQLHAQLRGAPELSDGIESLHYWQDRRRRLSWYNVRARREATRMILRWEDRLRDVIFFHPSAPVTARLSAGLFLARGRLGRWKRHAALGATVVVGISLAMLAIPLIAITLLLVHLA
jgi:hypothetical protein